MMWWPIQTRGLNTSRCWRRLKEATLTLILAKREFGRATVTYLEKQVGHGQVCPVGAKIQSIQEYPAPQTKHELRRLLGMAAYHCSFCHNFSDVVVPPHQFDQLSKAICLACQHAFESYKAIFCSTPVLVALNVLCPDL